MIAATVVPGMDAANNLPSLVIGVIVAPIFTVGLGLNIDRAASAGAATP